jgi:preprotein translocase subunit SecD
VKRTSLLVSLVSILVVVAIAAGFLVAGSRPQLGLDLQGGISAALQPDPDAGNQPEDLNQALDLAVDLIRQRVDSLGVAEPDIARQGDDTILVQLPGITDADRARQVIGQTAQLTFHPVERFVVPGTPEYAATPPCLVPETDAEGETVLGPDGEPVYVANPDRPTPTVPTEDGLRYVCGEAPDPQDDAEQPVDTGAESPRLQDLLESESASATPSDGASATPSEAANPSEADTATETSSPTEEPSGDALGAGEVTAADAATPSEAPSPTDGASGTEAPTQAPTFDDGLPADAPRPPKYVVGPVPTDEQALRDATPSDGETASEDAGEAATEEGALPGDPLTGDDVENASPTVGQGGWVVQLDLDADGGQAFQMVTAELACQRDAGQAGQLAIVLDDVVRSAPNMAQGVQCGEGIQGGSATITVGGSGDPEAAQEEAQNLALVLEVGALPLTLTEATFDTVSPSLGQASLRNGLIAGLIGLLLVGIYLIAFYRALGLVAIAALTVFGVLVIGTITLMGQVGFALTLAGVAGIIVSLGITADSSILYFERIRDEVSLGKTMRTASRRGFDSAFRTNLAGNTVTLAAALILYFLAVGPVRGFAFTLGLSTILDIIILWAFTRPVVMLLAGSRRLTRSSVRVREQAPAAPADATTSGGAA